MHGDAQRCNLPVESAGESNGDGDREEYGNEPQDTARETLRRAARAADLD
jgi:hypothetical protein